MVLANIASLSNAQIPAVAFANIAAVVRTLRIADGRTFNVADECTAHYHRTHTPSVADGRTVSVADRCATSVADGRTELADVCASTRSEPRGRTHVKHRGQMHIERYG